MRAPLRALLAALLVLAVAVPVGADDAEPAPPEFRESRVFFLCEGGDEAKLQNTNDSVRWGMSPPHRPLSEGAGCGYVNAGLLDDRPTYAGSVAGNLRSLAVELHTFPSAAHPRALLVGSIDLHVTLSVDGEVVVDDVLAAVPAPLDGSPPPVDSDGNWWLTQRVVLGIDGLDELLEVEEGAGTAVRDIALSIGTASPEEAVYWVWGTVEVPAGIAFNATAQPALTP